MEFLTQRGSSQFLIKHNDKHYMVNTDTRKVVFIESPDIIYKGGYCEEPNPSEAQKALISELLASK